MASELPRSASAAIIYAERKSSDSGMPRRFLRGLRQYVEAHPAKRCGFYVLIKGLFYFRLTIKQ